MSVKFSILVPAYNREGLIVECLQSIKNQSYTNYEVFLVDNESIDNTYNVALEFAQTYDKLQVYTAENIYPHCYDEAKELILPKCTGEYITIIADDDLIQNNYLKKLNSYIINNNYPQALQSPIKWFNHTTNKIMRTVGYNYNNITELKTQLLHHCCINTPTFTFHKDLKDSDVIKADPVTYSGAADYDLYCKLVDSGVFITPCKDWLGYFYRAHDQQATWDMVKSSTDHPSIIKKKWAAKWTSK